MVSIYYICHRERDRYTGSYNIFSCCGLFVLPTVQRHPPHHFQGGRILNCFDVLPLGGSGHLHCLAMSLQVLIISLAELFKL